MTLCRITRLLCVRSVMVLLLVCCSIQAFQLKTYSALFICSNPTSLKNQTQHELRHTVENCVTKIRISLNIKNSDKSPEEVQFLFVKEVVEAQTGLKMRLLNPFVVRFRQEQVLLAYPMKYLTAVNARAEEHVINYENTKNFTGCDDQSSVNPTCGIKHERGIPVLYSQGFCCYCPKLPTKGKQARGGQDCSIANSPFADIDIVAYKSSAHCLKKSGIWYTVNALDEPDIVHQVYLQVYAQYHLRNGSSVWYALTGDEDYALGTRNPHQFDENKTIVISHVTEKPVKESITIPYTQSRLLVPQPMIGVQVANIPSAIKNGPLDYLLIPKNIINPDGSDCDKSGVSYEGFYLQNDRCDVPQNSCLKNQPLDFWDSDTAAEEAGKKGSYKLKNFGVPYKDPIITERETNEHWLALEYYNPHQTYIYIEAKADNIIALSVGKYARILYVITESTAKSVNLHVSVQNTGLVSAEFTVQGQQCGFSVPDTVAKTETISPQLKADFTISSSPENIQLNDDFTCVVTVKSLLYGVIAKREVTIKPRTRCICNMHCLCACLDESLACIPMSEEDYHAAGFRGSLPVLTAKPPHRAWILKYPFAALLALVLILLLLGFIKATVGLAGFEGVAEFGLLPYIYKPKRITIYPDPMLFDEEVQYDEDGYPIHPNTGKRYKLYSPTYLFALNVCFFFVWPCAKCFVKQQKLPSSEDILDTDEDGAYDSRKFSIVSETENEGRNSLALDMMYAGSKGEEGSEDENQEIDTDFVGNPDSAARSTKFKGTVDKVAHIIQ